MSRVNKQGEYISNLISKSELALTEGFYLESIFLSHAIIEDRLRRTMQKVRSDYGNSRKIPEAVKDFRYRIKKKELLFDEYFSMDLINEIISWKKSKRDPLTHELEENFDLIDQDKIQNIAIEGNKISRNICTSVIKWKKEVKRKKILVGNQIAEL